MRTALICNWGAGMDNLTICNRISCSDATIIPGNISSPPGVALAVYRMTLYKEVTLFGSINFIFVVWILSVLVVGVWYCSYKGYKDLDDLGGLTLPDLVNIVVLSLIISGITLLFFAWYYQLL